MFSKFLLGKNAVVTGSLSGIGQGIARSLSAAGANIILNGFAQDSVIKKLQSELTNQHSRAKFIHADLAKANDCKKLIQDSIKQFGKIDILVNNTGIQHIDNVHQFPDEIWEKIIAINLSSSFYTDQICFTWYVSKKLGENNQYCKCSWISSFSKKKAHMQQLNMVQLASQDKLHFKLLKLEQHVILSICPGFVLTPLIQKQIQLKSQAFKVSLEEAKKLLIQQKQPSGDFSLPQDIGNFAVYLCSNSARQMTGGAFTIDGAWTAQ